ncbi:hypothetical protein NDR87_10540 [Nocardia sp. CDC159]|uniref:Uncharacterized protein n=1 Tax=Nocardia pulmonis TaxID=2951408 RepID=A0A9X2E419_9NOCA|nr:MULTISPECIES: hypothetical protein [Nocardia]MCM6773907.1 hypothetical protein [Nocardia pulmonis]MCM6786794.1 hypothetical protein [Nocardia sp. CDC159]
MGNTVTVQDLDADLGQLGEFEAGWKAQKEKLSWAADTINNAARTVVGGHWAGPASERYDQHRRKLVADLDEGAELAGKAATAVGACIHVLRFNQGLLNNEKAKLDGKVAIREYGSGLIELMPTDEEQTELVAQVAKAYEQIRGRVDQQLKAQTATIRAAATRLQALEATWTKRTLRMLNWNIQQGGDGNKVGNFLSTGENQQGTQNGDFGRIAQRIIDGKVDVATLQEVFKNGSQQLQAELDKRAAPGEKWEVHFGPASNKNQGERLGWPSEFGNAVVVRTGHGVTTGGTTVTDLGPGGPKDTENRSTTKVHIDVNR